MMIDLYSRTSDLILVPSAIIKSSQFPYLGFKRLIYLVVMKAYRIF